MTRAARRAALGLARRLAQHLRDEPFPAVGPATPDREGPRWRGLARALDTWVEQGRVVGGEIHVIQARRTVLHHAAGWLDRESGAPWLPGTLCDVRSMAKPVLATAALALAEDGVLSLTDPAARFLPSFDHDASRAITIEQLLRHTAGLDHPGFPASLRSYPDLRAAADDVGRTGPAVPPGSRFRYSDAGSAVLGAVVAAAAGEPVEAFIQRRILDPLGMTETFAFTPSDLGSRVASAYKPRGERFARYWRPGGAPKLHFYLAAGGLTTTTTDYARFLAAWMDGGRGAGERLLRGSTVAAALRSVPQTRLPEERGNHGMQWWLYSDPADGEDVQLVFGSDGSDGTWAMAVPRIDLMVLYFTQSRDGTTVFDAMGLVRERTDRHSGME